LAVGTTVERFAGPTVLWRDVPVSEVCHAILLEGEEWMVPTTAARFINHSCAPNCTVDDTLAVITLRAIADGEELTFSYDSVTMAEWLAAPSSFFWDARWTFKCRCGAPACVGHVDRYRVHGYENPTPVTPGTKLRLGPVPGKGRGVFATAPIAAGELFERPRSSSALIPSGPTSKKPSSTTTVSSGVRSTPTPRSPSATPRSTTTPSPPAPATCSSSTSTSSISSPSATSPPAKKSS
jgi:hypothetical protein